MGEQARLTCQRTLFAHGPGRTSQPPGSMATEESTTRHVTRLLDLKHTV